jgi:hypothetical protein
MLECEACEHNFTLEYEVCLHNFILDKTRLYDKLEFQ